MRKSIEKLIEYFFFIPLAFICLAAWSDVAGANTHLILHLASVHMNDGYYDYHTKELTPYNSNNLGIGAGFDLDDNFQIRAGGYKNSHYKTSIYAGLSLHTNINDPVGVGVLVGGVSGYENTVNQQKVNMAISPMVLPYVTARYKNVGFELGYLPTQNGLVTFSTSVAFR